MKRPFNFLIIIFFMLGSIPSYADSLIISNMYDLYDFTINIPNTYERVESDELLLYFVERADLVESTSDKALCIVYGDSANFGSHDPLYKYGEISTIKKQKSLFFRLNKNYEKKYYKAGNISLLCYSFQTYENRYSILFKYMSEQDLEQINSIIESIKIKDSWGRRVLLVWKKGYIIWMLLFIVVSFFGCFAYGESRGMQVWWVLCITICSIPLLLLFLWGAWDLFFTSLVLIFLIGYLCARIGMFLSPINY